MKSEQTYARGKHYARQMPNVRVLSFHGDLDVSRKKWIEQELAQNELFGPRALTILDLTDVRYPDTTFLNALIKARNHALSEQPQGDFRIVAPHNSIISRLLEITNLESVFHVFGDVTSARKGIW